ncbi:MAG: outer membrane protein assembly factor BamA [Candidatus Syntrophosphaera sp.]|nr:outer membrane protein assembly factor BamA [Candidatus Syntrophosphaera sp.]
MHRFERCLMLCLMLVFSLGSLFAAGQTIYEIRVDGARTVSRELVTSSISLRIGDDLDPEEVAKSIKQLYKMGVFSDIRVSTEPYQNGVNLIFQVAENPVLTQISYDGMSVVKPSRLDELVTVRIGTFWSQQQKQELIRKLRDEYHSKGFSNAKVDVTEEFPEEGKVRVTVKVDEGHRLAINSVTFVGNLNFDDKTLLKRMKTKPKNLLRSGRFEQAKFDQDLVNLAAYYKKNGFIDVRVGPYELKQIGERDLELVITIQEGIKYMLGSISISGNENFTSEALQSVFTLKYGEPFDQEKFDRQLAGVYSKYFDEGYIYTEIKPDIKKEGDQLNIELQVSEGNRARIRQIQITGNQRTKEKVIRRQLDIAPGDYFRQLQVIRTQQNIYNLGFFEPDIKLDYSQINENGDIDLIFDVIDKSSGSANGGIGYNSADGVVGQLSVSQNNLFGNNWSSSLMWEFGGSTQNFEFSFTNPNLLDSDLLLGSSLYYTKKTWSSFYYEIYNRGGSVRLGQYIPWVDRTRLVGGYSLYAKKYRITNMDRFLETMDPGSPLIELDSLDWRYTSALSATVSRDTRDSIFFPTRGTQLTLFSELAGGLLGGDFDYFKQIAQVNWYMETWYKITLRTKWRFGYITPYGSSEDAPPDEKFYLGGTGVDGVRGYADRSIGPKGGGSRAVIFSSEIGYPIGGDQIIAIGFFDAGDSYNHLREFNFLKLKKGVGAGIRIRSPFGLIGFDYAYNLEDGHWEPHLQFGTTF